MLGFFVEQIVEIISGDITSNCLGGAGLMVHSWEADWTFMVSDTSHLYQAMHFIGEQKIDIKNNAIRLNFYGVRNPILGNHKSISYCVVVYHYFVCHGFLQGVWYGAQPRCRQYTVVYVYYLVFFGARPWCMWATRCTLVYHGAQPWCTWATWCTLVYHGAQAWCPISDDELAAAPRYPPASLMQHFFLHALMLNWRKFHSILP